MDTITYADLQRNLAKTINSVVEEHRPIIVTRSKAEPVVIISVDDFASYEETALLLRNQANAKRISKSIEQIKDGHVVTMDVKQWKEKYNNGNT